MTTAQTAASDGQTRTLVGTALLAALFIVLPGAGHGQPAAAPDPLAHAQALIAAAANGDTAFRANSAGAVMQLQSGAVCVPGAEKMLLTGVDVFPTAPLGSDVGCEYRLQGGGLTNVFISPLGSRDYPQTIVEIIRDIVKLHPDAAPTTGPLTATLPSLEAAKAEAFTVSVDGQPCITSVWIARQGSWLITVRATYPAASRHDPELLSSFQVLNVQTAIQKHAAAAG